MWTNVGKSFAYLHIGPTTKYLEKFSSTEDGKCPLTDNTCPVGLCPHIPLNMAGTRIEPAISDPMPNSEAPAPINAPYKRAKS